MSISQSLSAVFKPTIICILPILLLSGCQLVKIEKQDFKTVIRDKSAHILTQDHLSGETLSLLGLLDLSAQQCKTHFKTCTDKLAQEHIFTANERFSALSELHLSHAINLAQSPACLTKKPDCIEARADALDQSLRYSYVYLFKSQETAQTAMFDYRNLHVRSFYNFALSQLILLAQSQAKDSALPTQFTLGKHLYEMRTSYYPELRHKAIENLQSSYNINVDGFNHVNRQDGLGAEFIAHIDTPPPTANQFILDPVEHYRQQANPNIHEPQYLSISATIQPQQNHLSVDKILDPTTPLAIDFYNPYRFKTASIEGQSYGLTANYSMPFAYWLAENKLGSSGYMTLLDRAEQLRMPHVYMLEPYQPNKKIIVMIHGLASSPETWVNLTNNILGDQALREQYQVWQVFYSTNMPIMESRFQIYTLLKQAFARTYPQSPSAKDAVLIGHSMGGIISRLLVSDADISAQTIPLLNYEQYTRLQQNPVIAERFKMKADLPFTRAIFIAAPHRGSDLTDRWYVELAKTLVKLPTTFFEQVDIQLNGAKSTKGIVHSGPDDLSPHSRFMLLSKEIMPKPTMRYHSIIGNKTDATDTKLMTDGIVPYHSSHLDGAVSEKVLKGGHSIHDKTETVLELRRILHQHLDQKN